jgi:hypothetical protein
MMVAREWCCEFNRLATSQNAMRKIIRDDSTRNTFQRWSMAALAGLHFCVTIIDTVSVTNEQLVSPLINGNVLRTA